MTAAPHLTNSAEAYSEQPYPAYKPSGVDWLGDVPAHWELKRLKTQVSNVVKITQEREDHELYLALEHVEGWTGRYVGAGHDVNFDSQVKRFQAGDVLLGKLRPYLAKVTRPIHNGVCVGEFLVLRTTTSGLMPPYLECFLRSHSVIDAINASTFGSKMPRADWQFIGGMRQPIPPLPEQRAIVRYLDHVDDRIRRYVATREKLIALLEEERQAVIHRAVTRGLDPNVPLKPSGVEWLGDIPAHWEMRRSKRLFSPRRELAGPSDIQLSATQELRSNPSRRVRAESRSEAIVKISLHLDKRNAMSKWTILSSACAASKVAWRGLGQPDASDPAYIVLRPTTEVDVEFFSYVFKSQAYIKALQSTANFIREGQDLNFNNFCAVDLPFPPLLGTGRSLSYSTSHRQHRHRHHPHPPPDRIASASTAQGSSPTW